MSAIRDGLHAHLSGDATLIAMLPGGAAGVFSDAERPAGIALPCVQIPGDVQFETIDGDGAIQVVRNILVMAERTGDNALVDAVAARVRALFEGAGLSGLTFAGYDSGQAFVSGPVETDPDAQRYGRVISVRLILFPA